jgi:hypothetical protein
MKSRYYVLLPGVALLCSCSARSPSTPSGFDRQLELNGIGFHVTSPNLTTGNTVTVTPTGLEIDNSLISWDADGAVTGAEVADLDADGSPEVYVYVMSTDATARGSLVAYSANKRKSLSAIYLPPLTETPAATQGYQGHDHFAVVGNSLVRRFPIYAGSATGASRTGRTRELQYRLVPGEAGWLLKIDRTSDF